MPGEEFEFPDRLATTDQQHGGSYRERRQDGQGKGDLVVEPVQVLLRRIKIDVNFLPVFVVFIVHASDDLVELVSHLLQTLLVQRHAGRNDGVKLLHRVVDPRHDTSIGGDFADGVAAVDALEADVDQVVRGRQVLEAFR
ncbi:hypothetical protein LJR234_003911 [Mesorhizobium amorphae]|uniref:hypothetical protein n=1 Tax=Mesorhizobium amorphae TaxID=71433 RepID=UPI003ED0ACCB